MPKFGPASLKRLQTCNSLLQQVAEVAINIVDFSILEGIRDKATQDKYFAEGKSKLVYPESKHNKDPSDAFDFQPYPFNMSDTEASADPEKRRKAWMQYAYIAGVIVGIGHSMGIKLRSGLDFNRNGRVDDSEFKDAPHVELDE